MDDDVPTPSWWRRRRLTPREPTRFRCSCRGLPRAYSCWKVLFHTFVAWLQPGSARLRRYPRIRTEDRGSCPPRSHFRTRHEHAKSTRSVSHAGHGRLQHRSPRPGVPDPIGPASSSTHTTSCSARARPLLLAFRCDRSASCPSRLRGVPCVVFGTCAAQYEAFERPRVVARACCGRTSKVRWLRSGGGGRLQWRLGEGIESNDEGIDETEGRCASAGTDPRSEKGGRFVTDAADKGKVGDEDPRGGRRRTVWIVGSDRRWRSTVEIRSPPTTGERRPTHVPNGGRCDRTTCQTRTQGTLQRPVGTASRAFPNRPAAKRSPIPKGTLFPLRTAPDGIFPLPWQLALKGGSRSPRYLRFGFDGVELHREARRKHTRTSMSDAKHLLHVARAPLEQEVGCSDLPAASILHVERA